MRSTHIERQKTDERLAIEGALRNAALAGRGLTNTELCEATTLPAHRVRRVTAKLLSVGQVTSTGAAGGQGARYTWARGVAPVQAQTHEPAHWQTHPGGPALFDARNGPGFRISAPVGSMPTRATARITAASVRETYLAPELKANPGITPDRFEAYLLPSLVNGRRVPSVHARQAGTAGGLA